MTNKIETGILVLQESRRLVSRDPSKYGKLVLGLHLLPIMMRGGGLGRDSYFFMRHIDDVLDGDLKISGDPLNYVKEIRQDIDIGINTSGKKIEMLALESIRKLNRKKKPGDVPKREFLAGIDGMIRDYNRASTREAMDSNGLKDHYINGMFGPHHNICLMAVESDLRSKDIETFLYCQGLAYTIRDLSEDWQKGIINIPKEVLGVSGLETSFPIEEIENNQVLREWVADEAEKGGADLKIFFETLSKMRSEREASLLLRSLGKQVKEVLETSSRADRIISRSGSN